MKFGNMFPTLAIGCLLASATMIPAQTAATASAPASAPANADFKPTSVNVDLVGWLDSKKAKAGDPFVLKTTQTVRTSQGTEIKKGTKLVGTILATQSFQKDKGLSQMSVEIDYADLGGGNKLPLNTRIMRIDPSDQVANNSNSDGAGVSASARVAAGTTSTSNGAGNPRSSPLATSSVNGSVGNLTQIQDKFNGNNEGAQGNQSAAKTGVPGLLLSSSSGGNVAAILAGVKMNILLDSGTHIQLAIVQK
jgi:hypothetical protein